MPSQAVALRVPMGDIVGQTFSDIAPRAPRELTPGEVVACIGDYTEHLLYAGWREFRFMFHKPWHAQTSPTDLHPACLMLRTPDGACYWVPRLTTIAYIGPYVVVQFRPADFQESPYVQMGLDTLELHIGHAVARFSRGRRLAYGESR